MRSILAGPMVRRAEQSQQIAATKSGPVCARQAPLAMTSFPSQPVVKANPSLRCCYGALYRRLAGRGRGHCASPPTQIGPKTKNFGPNFFRKIKIFHFDAEEQNKFRLVEISTCRKFGPNSAKIYSPIPQRSARGTVLSSQADSAESAKKWQHCRLSGVRQKQAKG
jgi:hypothetical protein